MKHFYWKFRKIFSQIFVLILIGIAVYWVYKNMENMYTIVPETWVKIIFGICFLFYVILVISTVKSLATSNVVRSYNPTDPQSLRTLNEQSKYKLKVKKAVPGTIVQDVEQWLYQQGYKKVSMHQLGILFEKKTPFITWMFKRKSHRTFLLYRPLLNVLIVDNILSEISAFIHQYESVKPVSQNDLILISDMKNEEEILSAGTGIVNFVCSRSSGYLYPVFIDMNHNHIFYPQDISLLPWYKRISRKIHVSRIKALFNKPVSSK